MYKKQYLSSDDACGFRTHWYWIFECFKYSLEGWNVSNVTDKLNWSLQSRPLSQTSPKLLLFVRSKWFNAGTYTAFSIASRGDAGANATFVVCDIVFGLWKETSVLRGKLQTERHPCRPRDQTLDLSVVKWQCYLLHHHTA